MKKQIINYYNNDEYIRDSEKCAYHELYKRKKIINKFSVKGNFVEIGCGTALLKKFVKNYIGLDISLNALQELNGNGIRCDLHLMPLKRMSAHNIASFNTLEHMEEPEKVIEECDFVLKNNGIIILSDAYHCSRQKDMFYYVYFAIGRLFDEIKHFLGLKTNLRYKKIIPDYTKIGGDYDALSSLDPHNVTKWFESRGYTCLNKKPGIFYFLNKNPYSEISPTSIFIVLKKSDS